MLFRAVSRSSGLLLQSRIVLPPQAAFFVKHPLTRCFTVKADPTSKIEQAVKDYIINRRAELEQYEPVDAADKEETTKLVDNLRSASVDKSTVFRSLGFDGLDEVEIVLALEEALGITLPEEEFHSIRGVSDAVGVFSKYTPKQG